MKELIQNQNGQAVTNSLLVAQKFNKNHQHVIRDIESLEKDVSKFGQMFLQDEYDDTYRRKQPMYIMNRDGFTLLAMGFTGKKALGFKLEYIEAFNSMEEKLKEIAQTPQKQLSTLDLLELTIKGMRENQEGLQEVKQEVREIQARIATQPDCFSIAGYATLYGMPVNLNDAKMLGTKCKKICKDRGIRITTTPDPRFGKVNIYPTSVLKEVFSMFYN